MDSHVLYRFYNSNAKLLYVGITNNPENRFGNHRREKPWWNQVTAITLERFSTRGELAQAEIEAIQTERPKYNLAYATESPPDTVRIHERTQATPLWPDASRFGNIAPPDRGPTKPLRIRLQMPCPDCYTERVYKDATEYGEPADDLVRCPDCMNVWLDEEWTTLTLGI